MTWNSNGPFLDWVCELPVTANRSSKNPSVAFQHAQNFPHLHQAAGAFGKVVYSEGEYFHDWDHGLYEVMKTRAGERWREEGGSPPMHYPTHSTGGVVSILKSFATHVSCRGFVDDHEDGIYGAVS